jgi:hypothetical protein
MADEHHSGNGGQESEKAKKTPDLQSAFAAATSFFTLLLSGWISLAAAEMPPSEIFARSLIVVGLATLGGLLILLGTRITGFFRRLLPSTAESRRQPSIEETKEQPSAEGTQQQPVSGRTQQQPATTGTHQPGKREARRRPSATWVLRILLALMFLGAVLVVANPPWGPCPLPTEVRVLASAETAPLIERVAAGFADDRRDWRGCRAVHLTISAPLSAAGMRTWLTGGWDSQVAGPAPDLWIADSRAEIDEIGDDGSNPLILGKNPEVVATSPVVLAVPQAEAAHLNRLTDKSWLTVLRQMLTKKVLRAHPRASNVGLLTTVGLYEGSLGTDGPALRQRQEVEGRVSTEVGWFDDAYDLMCDEIDSVRPSAMYLTEQQLYDFNQARAKAPGGAWVPGDCPGAMPAATPTAPATPTAGAAGLPGDEAKPPLHPVYFDGEPSMVYHCVPTAWADRRASDAVGALVTGFCAELKLRLPRLGLRTADGTLTITDKANALKRTPFGDLTWPPHLRRTLDLAKVPPQIDHLALAMDVSGSMAKPLNAGSSRWQAAAETAEAMIGTLSGQLTTSLWATPGDTEAPFRRVVMPTEERARTSDAVLAELAAMAPNRALNDAPLHKTMANAVAELRGVQTGRRTLVVFSDGGTPAGLSAETLGDLDGVQIIVLAFGGRGCALDPLPALVRDKLLTCHPANVAEPAALLETIRADLLAKEEA